MRKYKTLYNGGVWVRGIKKDVSGKWYLGWNVKNVWKSKWEWGGTGQRTEYSWCNGNHIHFIMSLRDGSWLMLTHLLRRDIHSFQSQFLDDLPIRSSFWTETYLSEASDCWPFICFLWPHRQNKSSFSHDSSCVEPSLLLAPYATCLQLRSFHT